MNAKDQLNKVKALLGLQVKLEQMKLDNGAVFEAEVFEAGQEVFVIADDEKVAVPVGEYTTEDGQMIVVAEEGVIAEVKEASAEEDQPEPKAEEVVEEEEMSEEKASPKKIVKSISEEQFFSEIEKLREEISNLKLSLQPKEEVKEVEKEVELSSQEEVEGIIHNPEVKAEKRELHLYSQKRKVSTLDRIFNTLNK